MIGDSEHKKQRFSQLGSKWNQLSNGQKEVYNARDSEMNESSTIQSLTDPQRFKRIMTNMMKEVNI